MKTRDYFKRVETRIGRVETGRRVSLQKNVLSNISNLFIFPGEKISIT